MTETTMRSGKVWSGPRNSLNSHGREITIRFWASIGIETRFCGSMTLSMHSGPLGLREFIDGFYKYIIFDPSYFNSNLVGTCQKGNGSVNSRFVMLFLRNANKQEVIKAYRKLAQQWHPDNFQSESDKKEAEKRFIDIASAKEVLIDPGTA